MAEWTFDLGSYYIGLSVGYGVALLFWLAGKAADRHHERNNR